MDYLSQVVKAANSGKAIPLEPQWNKWIHRNLSDKHCEECLKLHKCWFAKWETPKWPHHDFCHCILEDIPYTKVMYNCTADSAYSKFDPYLFDTKGVYGHGKEKMFNSWGYSVADSQYLKEEIEKQGLQKYIYGEYTLGKLNKDGQRINIVIEIERKDKKGTVTFVSGWMVYPNGHIQLTTPYGGK